MGNFLVFKPVVNAAYREYARIDIATMHKNVYARFLQLQAQAAKAAATVNRPGSPSRSAASSPIKANSSKTSTPSKASSSGRPTSSHGSVPALGNFGFEIDFACFHAIFATLSQEDAAARFALWDADSTGQVDILEVVAAMVLLATASFEEKVAQLYRVFNFRDSAGGLSYFELHALISRCAHAWSRVLGGDIYDDEIEEVAKRALFYLSHGAEQGRGKEAEVPLHRLLTWCGVTTIINFNICKHNTTDAEEARAYWPALLTGTFATTPSPAAAARVEDPAETLHRDAVRIHAAFRNWMPTHRLLMAERSDSPPRAPRVHGKFTTPTASSLAKGAKLKTKHAHMVAGSGGGGSGARKDADANGSGDKASASASSSSTRERDPDELQHHRPAYLALRRIKAKVQTRRTKDDQGFMRFVYDSHMLKQARDLFDAIDTSGDGEITIAELTAMLERSPLGDRSRASSLISAFSSLDVDQSGTIDFNELLRAIFPLATTQNVKQMAVECKAIEIKKKDIEALQKIFEWIDEDFDGKVSMGELLCYLRDPSTDPTGKRKPYARGYTASKAVYEHRALNFSEAVHELFAKSHAHMIADIRRWAAALPVPALTDAQHVELEQLFALYDADNSGTIDMQELEQHFSSLGFSEADNERMFRLFDRDGGQSIDMVEFKRFYRSVYDSTKMEDYGRGVTSFAGGDDGERRKR